MVIPKTTKHSKSAEYTMINCETKATIFSVRPNFSLFISLKDLIKIIVTSFAVILSEVLETNEYGLEIQNLLI
jgi:hypothetical protein